MSGRGSDVAVQPSTLRGLFEAARELHGAARQDFLAGVDATLRAQLDRLLDADVDTGDGARAGDPMALVAALEEPVGFSRYITFGSLNASGSPANSSIGTQAQNTFLSP